MLLALAMLSPSRARLPYRPLAAAGCAALLAASVSACGATQKMTTGLKVRSAVEKLGEQPDASLIASVGGTREDAYGFLRRTQGGDATRSDAARLARAELTLTVGSGDEQTALKDMPKSDGLAVAAALNFGGTDAVAVKSVHDRLYVRLRLSSLVRQAGGSQDQRRLAGRIEDLADDLPTTLASARDALKGRWVKADPAAFDDFALAAEKLSAQERQQEKREPHGKSRGQAHGGAEKRAEGSTRHSGGSAAGDSARRAEQAESGDQQGPAGRARQEAKELRDRIRSHEVREAALLGSALDGQSQREFVEGAEKLLREHASFKPAGVHAGTERVRVTLPGRTAARDLATTLTPLGVRLDPHRVPDRPLTGTLSLRRGQLVGLALDLGQFTGGGGHEGTHEAKTGKGRKDGKGAAPRLPLRITFGSGHAVPVIAPGGAKELHPQDLIATVMYGAIGTRGL